MTWRSGNSPGWMDKRTQQCCWVRTKVWNGALPPQPVLPWSLVSLQGRSHTSTAGALLQSGSVRHHSELPGCCQPREPAAVTHRQTDLTHPHHGTGSSGTSEQHRSHQRFPHNHRQRPAPPCPGSTGNGQPDAAASPFGDAHRPNRAWQRAGRVQPSSPGSSAAPQSPARPAEPGAYGTTGSRSRPGPLPQAVQAAPQHRTRPNPSYDDPHAHRGTMGLRAGLLRSRRPQRPAPSALPPPRRHSLPAHAPPPRPHRAPVT